MSGTADETYRQHRFRRPRGACEILLVRHGESQPADPNAPFPLVDGHGDPALDPRGHAQAEKLAERLGSEAIDALYVTTLRRTVQTAAPLAARLGLSPQVEADLREVHLGDWEGGAFRKFAAEGHPLIEQIFTQGRWDVIPGSEPAEVFGARVRGGINRIAVAHPDALVVAVVHGGVIGEAIGQAVGVSGLAFSGADNASISHLVVTGERWVVRRFNDTAHLTLSFLGG